MYWPTSTDFTATWPALGWYFTNTRPTLHSLGQLLVLSFIFSAQLREAFSGRGPFLAFNSGNIHRVFFLAMFFPRHRFHIQPSSLSEVAAFGTTALSSCHMDGFFSSRSCDNSQLLVAWAIPPLVAECVLSEYKIQKKGSRNVVNTHLVGNTTFFTFISCSQIHVVFYRGVIHGWGLIS